MREWGSARGAQGRSENHKIRFAWICVWSLILICLHLPLVLCRSYVECVYVTLFAACCWPIARCSVSSYCWLVVFLAFCYCKHAYIQFNSFCAFTELHLLTNTLIRRCYFPVVFYSDFSCKHPCLTPSCSASRRSTIWLSVCLSICYACTLATLILCFFFRIYAWFFASSLLNHS